MKNHETLPAHERFKKRSYDYVYQLGFLHGTVVGILATCITISLIILSWQL